MRHFAFEKGTAPLSQELPSSERGGGPLPQELPPSERGDAPEGQGGVLRAAWRKRMRTAAPLLAALLVPVLAPGAPSPSLALRARIEPAAARHYVGQRVRLVLEAEARGAEISQIQLFGLPDAEWAQKVAEAELEGERGVRDGETTHVWRYAIDYLLASSGTHGFQPRIRTTLATRTQRGNGPAFIFSSSVERPASAAGDAISLDVSAPPVPAPADFCGLVGDFRLTATLDPAEAAPGDLVNLRWSLAGLGNVEDFHPPALAAPEGLFRAYAPKNETPADARDRIDVAQVFVPQSLAATNLPPLAVTVFDPVAGTYRTLRAGPFALRLVERKADDAADWPISADSNRQDSADAGEQPRQSPESTAAAGSPASPRVLAAPTIGRFAPSASSRKLRTLPAGTAVEEVERSGAWARVAAPGGPSVWIPAGDAPSAPSRVEDILQRH